MSSWTVQIASITFEQVVEEFREIVAEKGEDYVYPYAGGSCMYFEESWTEHKSGPEGSPSCIVGHWFAKHGLTHDDLIEDNNAGVVSALDGLGLFSVEPRAVDFMEAAQGKQDIGTPWGEAVAHALACVAQNEDDGEYA